jgi:hypothetical protein
MDPSLFFPEKGQTAKSIEAQIACFRCEVREACREYKVKTHSTDGIWAGEFSERGKKD